MSRRAASASIPARCDGSKGLASYPILPDRRPDSRELDPRRVPDDTRALSGVADRRLDNAGLRRRDNARSARGTPGTARPRARARPRDGGRPAEQTVSAALPGREGDPRIRPAAKRWARSPCGAGSTPPARRHRSLRRRPDTPRSSTRAPPRARSRATGLPRESEARSGSRTTPVRSVPTTRSGLSAAAKTRPGDSSGRG